MRDYSENIKNMSNADIETLAVLLGCKKAFEPFSNYESIDDSEKEQCVVLLEKQISRFVPWDNTIGEVPYLYGQLLEITARGLKLKLPILDMTSQEVGRKITVEVTKDLLKNASPEEKEEYAKRVNEEVIRLGSKPISVGGPTAVWAAIVAGNMGGFGTYILPAPLHQQLQVGLGSHFHLLHIWEFLQQLLLFLVQ